VPAGQEGIRVPADLAARWGADAAVGAARELAGSASSVLVHTDLHGGNVLAGDREPWLAIDPERSVPELLWTRVDDVPDAAGFRAVLAEVVAAGHLDADRARAWVLARTVDHWLWAVGVGLTEDPRRCARVLAAVLAR